MQKPIEDQLDDLLNEDIDSAIDRERRTFDRLVAPFGKSIVLFGAGRIGGRVLAALRADGKEPLCFADDNPALWGKSVDGLPVLSPQDAVLKFGGKVAFVVTIWRQDHSFVRTRKKLISLYEGCNVLSGFYLLWKYDLPHFIVDLPHKIIEQADLVRKCFSLWADARSRSEYLAHLRWRLLVDFESLLEPVVDQYFPEDIFHLISDEVFVDCGAFDGDTIKSFIQRRGVLFSKIIALEPDPINFEKLQKYTATLARDVREKIVLLPLAVGNQKKKVTFDARGTEGSVIASNGNLVVLCDPLDWILQNQTPTYIKMDIEGAELEALAGGSGVIRRARPVLAICLYHAQDYLWHIPLFVHKLFDRYSFFLRTHAEDGFELCLYAVPPERVVV